MKARAPKPCTPACNGYRTPPLTPPPGALASPGPAPGAAYWQPAANRLRKHMKSLMFRIGGIDDPSQLAYASPAVYFC